MKRVHLFSLLIALTCFVVRGHAVTALPDPTAPGFGPGPSVTLTHSGTGSSGARAYSERLSASAAPVGPKTVEATQLHISVAAAMPAVAQTPRGEGRASRSQRPPSTISKGRPLPRTQAVEKPRSEAPTPISPPARPVHGPPQTAHTRQGSPPVARAPDGQVARRGSSLRAATVEDHAPGAPTTRAIKLVVPLDLRPVTVIAAGVFPDLCQDALRIDLGPQPSASTARATIDIAEACGTAFAPSAPGLWYKVIGTGNGMTATTCHEGTDFDTQISVFCGGCDNLICVDGNDDTPDSPEACLLNGPSRKSTVNWCSEQEQEYLILVHGFGSNAGNFILEVLDNGDPCGDPISCATAPPHDECGDCVSITTGVPHNSSSVGATGSSTSSCGGGGDTADVWHCWTADCTGTATFSLCGSLYDTTLAVFDDCGGNKLACNDDACGLQSEIVYNVVLDTTYFIRVAGYGGATGDYELKVTCGAPTGSCCDENTGVCQDGIAPANCQEPLRFTAGILCADLDPACAGPPALEACCFPDGLCVDYSREECLERGGTRQGTGTNCDTTTCPQPCELTCPAGSTQENETDCGLPVDTVNGGCNSSPPVFSRIGCGETVCGTAAVDYQVAARDTDWYEISVTQPTSFTWTVKAEFAYFIGVVNTDPYGAGDCGASRNEVNPSAFGSVCGDLSVTVCVGPGTYWFFVAPDSSEEFPCGERRKYVAGLTCDTCVTGACCRSSGNCAIVGGTTCDDLGGVYAGDGTECDPNCCQQTPEGADVCFDAIPYAIPVNSTPVAVSGDNSNATAGGACDSELTSAPLWWEAFRIDTCADVLIDYCCTNPWANPVYAVLNDACPECNLIWSSAWGPGGGLSACADTNMRVLWEGLPAGDYTYPIFSDLSGTLHGPYQLHITAYPCTSGACCLDGTCIDTMSRLQCTERGGTWFNGEDCSQGYLCPGAVGACCDDSTGICQDGDGPADCQPPRRFTAGILCADLDPPCAGPTLGACCVSGNCVGTMSQSDCASQPGTWYENEDCIDFTCPPPPTCPDNTLYGQLPHLPSDAWFLGVSDADLITGQLLRYESFGSLNAPICDVHWWGSDIFFDTDWTDCTENPMTFNVKFYQHAAGAFVPGSEVCSYQLNVLGVPTEYYYLGYEMLEYHADLSPCCDLSDGWISIQGTGGSDCWFLWTSSPVGDGKACLRDGTLPLDCSGTSAGTGYDLSMCLTGSPVPLGACCYVGGDCADSVPEVCANDGGTPQGPGTSCATMVCHDEPSEACCFPGTGEGHCLDMPPTQCEQQQGIPQGPETSCTVDEACCLPSNTCVMNDPLCCDELGGTRQGSGSDCANMICGCPDATITIEILTDGWPDETTWELVEQGAGGVASGGPYASPSTLITEEVCVSSASCYDFTIYDSYGDGIFAPGGYKVSYNGTVSADTIGSGWTGSSETVSSIGDGCAPPGACCILGKCAGGKTQESCVVQGGQWAPNEGCANVGCPSPPQACCISDLTCAGLLEQYCTASCVCDPDMNCDGTLDASDVSAFALALNDPGGHLNAYPNCDIWWADLDCDLDLDDLDGTLFNCLVPQSGPPECIDIDPASCSAAGGSPRGSGTDCTGVECGPLDCTPTADGLACEAVDCPIETDTCVPRTIDRNLTSEPPWEVIECDCLPEDACRVVSDANAEPPVWCEGRCQAGFDCALIATDVDGDGTDNRYECGCRPSLISACCFPDGRCEDLPPETCLHQGGEPRETGMTCENVTCPAPPVIERDIFEETTAFVQLVGGPLGTVPVSYVLRGPAEVHVFFEGTPEGTADDDDGDTRDEVNTELILLSLTDGTVNLSLQPDRPSRGQIEELVNNTPEWLDLDPFANGDAESFFDVFFQIEIGGLVLHNEDPLRIQSVITEKPPIARYFHILQPESPIELFDANGRPTGVFVVKAEHDTGHTEVDSFEASWGELELIDPSGGSQVISLSGTTKVAVFFEPGEGQARDGDTNGLDEVQTEMLELNLTGLGETVGPVHVRLHPDLRSTGMIEEKTNNTSGVLDVPPFGPPGSMAGSFFDLYFQVEVPDRGQTFYTIDPKRMSGQITHKPPGPLDFYQNLQEIQLYDAEGNQTEYFLGTTRHRPRPPVEIDEFDFSFGVLDLVGPNGTESIQMTGPATVTVYFEGNQEGNATDDDNNQLDEVITQMTDLNLTGISSMGPVHVRLHPTIASTGQIEEKVDHTTGVLDVPPFGPPGSMAGSFFNLYFQVTLPDLGKTFYTIDPKRMSGQITHKPPGPLDFYENREDIPLVNEFGFPTGFFLGATRHRPRPPVEIDEFDFSLGATDILLPDGSTETVEMTGPATVAVYFEGTQDGNADDDDSNQLDEVVMQMTDLNLSGFSPLLGPVHVTLNPNISSTGHIEEKVDHTSGVLDVPPFGPPGSTASSYFDLYFQVSVAGQTYLTVQPKRMSGQITNKPPGPMDFYENREDIPLVNQFGFPTGFFLGATRHRPRPPVEIDEFDFSLGAMDILLPDGSTETVQMTGPATVAVYFEGTQDGQANDDGKAAGLDEVMMQMTDLNLTGFSPLLGPVHVTLNPNISSTGQIEEKVNYTSGVLDVPPFGPPGSTASSYFDLYFQVTVVGRTFLTVQPKRMSGQITHKPPGPLDWYENREDIPLVNEFGFPTGFFLGATRHRPRPPVEIDEFDLSIGLLEIIMPGGQQEMVQMTGPARVAVYFEGSQEGDADDDNGNQLEEVVTEMVRLELSGFSSKLGPVQVTLNPDIPSTGLIEEQANDTQGMLDVPPFTESGTADSYFDLYFQVTVGGQTFYTVQPKRMSSKITHKPPAPADFYENREDIPLVNEFGFPTGYYLGATRHRPRPPCHGTDVDGDQDTDLPDYRAFHGCLAGPAAGPPSAECLRCFDFDGDNDVDMVDVSVVQSAFTGSW